MTPDHSRAGDAESMSVDATPAIAVIGLSCRLPGAPDPRSFWQMLRDGVSGITDVPADRWDAPALAAEGIQRGGFLDDIDRFDPDFFGISPREAAGMDPQQRLMLELAWEALENASIPPTTLRGAAVGVFVGAISDDYATLAHRRGLAAVTHLTLTGTHRSIIANRISYLLGLRGPSMTIDSAQSSSLVSVQLACESLRRGDTTVALAGGVSLALAAESAIGAARFGALSPDGECYVFDARANGYVRGEGGGLVVLKPLAAALKDGDPIRCVIRGGAINNDGGGAGLTVPSSDAQEEVLRRAWARADVAPSAVQYVELHGTGTRVGDPVEAAALGAALGAERPADDPLLVGSAKTNVGHLEGAAGIVGLIKVALSIHHRQLPASLNFKVANPGIPLRELGLQVQARTRPWPWPDRPLVAGVSSFGMGGTNCHLVVTEPPLAAGSDTDTPTAARAALPWVISGRSPGALAAQAAALRDWLPGSTSRPADIAAALIRSRPAFEHRAVVVTSGGEPPYAALDALAVGDLPPAAARGTATITGGCVFVFPGQGSQWAGMGAELLETSEVFAARMAECEQSFAPFTDWSVTDLVRGAPGTPKLDRDDLVQPALFAVMVSLAELWRSLGLEPAAVVGHSQGEIAAACVAGVLPLPQAAMIVARRSQMLAELSGYGGMASVPLGLDEVQRRLAAWTSDLVVAGVNGPGSTVVSGKEAALVAFMAQCEADGLPVRRVPIDYASHSPHMETLRERLLATIGDVVPGPAGIPFYSTVTGGLEAPAGLGPEYWYRNLRSPVRFDQAIGALLSAGHRTFVEVSPHPILTGGIQDSAEAAGAEVAVGGSLRRDQGGWPRFLAAAAELYVQGAPVDWTHLFSEPRPYAELPAQAFQRHPYWLDSVPAQEPPSSAAESAAPNSSTSESALLNLVRVHAATILGFENADAIDPSRAFKDLGFDSVTSVELRNRLAAATGSRLPAALLYNYPTPGALARQLHASPAAETPESEAAGPLADDPIVIVGMACRYPGGVASPESLWRLAANETDAIGEFPDSRGWDLDAWYDADSGVADRAYTRCGGFLADADQFDPAFFGISPREALAMDPQQRLLLETAWEALERAGIRPRDLAGTRTGVYVGVMAQDYGPRLHQAAGESGGYLLTGNSPSVASGRIAYTLGLEGPALTVDTACSSSLVAVHLAVRALRAGECSLALAGGAAVLATPGMLVEFSRQYGLSPDGRCKPFAAAADGTAWAEGAGLILLERLSDATRLGHPVLAVVRGTAINSDGASNGLTAPNGPAQERVIRQALADAGLTAGGVDAVEAHGTGTTLGDPIEADALIATYGQDRPPGQPLWIGSVKSNIGHAQAAAGVAGIIKMVEAMHRGLLPRTLHVDAPTPHVDWEAGSVALLTEPTAWPDRGRPRRAAVSSFGISGTNAHVIVEGVAAADDPVRRDSVPVPVPWVLSAAVPEALPAQARRLAAYLAEHPSADPADVGYSLATTRTHHAFRAAVIGHDRESLMSRLGLLARGEDDPRLARGTGQGRSGNGPGRIAFVFPGQGAQWPGMATELLETSVVFEAHVRACADALAPHIDWSLIDVLNADPQAADLARVDVLQPVLFAVMTGLAVLWRHYGVEPDAVVGHSQGEIAAAWVAGALSLDDAALVVARRSQALTAISGVGGMVALARPADEVQRLIGRWGDEVSIASFNGPASTVVSGSTAALDDLLAACERSGVHARRITVDYASHSAQVEVVRDKVIGALAGVTPRPSQVDFYSTLTGEVIDTTELNADYWYRSMRLPVRYEQATRLLLQHGRRLFIEVSPHPVLTVGTLETIEHADVAAHAMGTLRRDDGGQERLLTAVAETYAHGAAPNWETVFAVGPRRRVALPTYAFQRESYWSRPAPAAPDLPSAGASRSDHPILGASLRLAGGQVLYTGQLSLATHQWLADHAVGGRPILPGTALLDLALFAGREAGAAGLAELTLHGPVLLPAQGALRLQVYLTAPDEAGGRTLAIDSQSVEAADDGGGWTRHATGILEPPAAPASPPPEVAWPPSGEPVDLAVLDDDLAARGYEYGPCFQGLAAAWRASGQVHAEARTSDNPATTDDRFAISPPLLDALLHPILDPPPEGAGRLLLPFSFTGVRLWRTAPGPLRARLTLAGAGRAALAVVDGNGLPVLTVESLAFREVAAAALGPAPATRPRSLFQVSWQATETGSTLADGAGGPVAVLGDAPGLTRALAAAGQTFLRYDDLAALRNGEPHGLVLATVKPGGTAAAAHSTAKDALALLQDWLGDEYCGRSTLVIVTQGAVSTEAAEDVSDLAGAAVWGLVRSAVSENPGCLALADLDGSPSSGAALLAAVAAGEPQVAVRDGVARVPRLTDSTASPLPAGRGWRFDVTGRGTLDYLALVDNEAALRPLAPGEVRVAVRAAGLNFHDLVLLLGMVADEGGVGLEGAGVVEEVGAGVTSLRPGDRVMGLFTGAFGPAAVADHRMLAPIPDSWTFADAASVPVTFLTAQSALADLGGLRAGDRVLVHAAAGGVGMAALQLARRTGAEIYGTASPGKWPALRRAGFAQGQLASSRTLEFEAKFRSETGGRGMDVVLNSLAGEFTDASLRLLARGGRFIELGKTDIRDAEEVSRAHSGAHYETFDLQVVNPDRISAMLAGLLPLFQAGELTPLPVTAFEVRHLTEAFRYLLEARHTGKVVVTLPVPVNPDGTVLITGGTGMLGGLVARHLVTAYGVRHLLLASRQGPAAAGVDELVAGLQELGATAAVVGCDLSDRDSVQALVDSVPAGRPLTAVIHAAGVLDDAVIGSLTGQHLDTALHPKADGAWHLHELTRGSDLAAFVLFSSVAGLLGLPGQGNYAAANTFLDALAQRRRARGLPGMSLAWGLWAPASGMTRHMGQSDVARMARLGISPLTAQEGLALLDAALESDQSLAAAFRLARRPPQSADDAPPAMLEFLLPAARPTPAAGPSPAAPRGATSLPERLRGLSAGDRRGLLLEFVCDSAAAVLGRRAGDRPPPDHSFKELGFDSLTAVELRNRLIASTGLRLPATIVFDHPTPSGLAKHLSALLAPADKTPPADLDQIMVALRAMAVGADRGEVAARLRPLLADLAMAEEDGEERPVSGRVGEATAEELFSIIDQLDHSGN